MTQSRIESTNKNISEVLVSQLKESVKSRLRNWGRWYRKENFSEIQKDTGRLKSPAGDMLDIAPFRSKSGYWTAYPEPINYEDAEALHEEILRKCTMRQKKALILYYSDFVEFKDNSGERMARMRAIQVLAGLHNVT